MQRVPLVADILSAQALVSEVDDDIEQPVPKRFYEITIASVDQPRLLSRLSDALVRSSPHTTPPYSHPNQLEQLSFVWK